MMSKRCIFALLLAILLLAAAPAPAEEEMDWYIYWTKEIGVNIGEKNGDLEEKYKIRNYNNYDDGTTSAIVGEESAGSIVWLREESDGRHAWYGLDNSNGVFAQGSRFWVRWLSKEQDQAEWQRYYDKFDDEHKNRVEDNRQWIFEVGVTAPSGEEYTKLDQDVQVYIQLDDAWDAGDLCGVYIAEDADEQLEIKSENRFVYPEGEVAFLVMELEHFSPYAIYDAVSTGGAMVGDGSAAGSDLAIPEPQLPQTGDASRMGLWLALLAISGAAGLALRALRRREN